MFCVAYLFVDVRNVVVRVLHRDQPLLARLAHDAEHVFERLRGAQVKRNLHKSERAAFRRFHFHFSNSVLRQSQRAVHTHSLL